MVKDSLGLNVLDAEIAVLGSLILEPKLVGPVIAEVYDDDFTDTRTRLIFQAIKSLFRRGDVVDPVTICNELGTNDTARKDVLTVMEMTPTAANIWSYIPLMKDQARVWKMREIASQITLANDLDSAKALVSQLNDCLVTKNKAKHFSASDLLALFGERHMDGKSPEYIPWGIPKLEQQVRSERGDFIIIGGTPSSGKTALALQFAWSIAKRMRVGFYSLETSEVKLADRSVAALADIHMGSIKKNKLTFEEWGKYAELGSVVADVNLDVIPAAGWTVEEIAADALSNRFDVVFIDYLQLIRSQTKRQDRVEQVTQISLELHEFAQRRGVAVVALSQLSRESHQSNEPGMNHLRGSGQIEADADVIMLLYRCPQPDIPHLRGLRVAKNKDGPVGKVFLGFNGGNQRFWESPFNPEEAKKAKKTKKPETAGQQSEAADFEEITEADPKLPF